MLKSECFSGGRSEPLWEILAEGPATQQFGKAARVCSRKQPDGLSSEHQAQGLLESLLPAAAGSQALKMQGKDVTPNHL